jgi:hypothetical protein
MSSYGSFVSRVADPYHTNQHIDDALENLYDDCLPRQTLKDRENPLESIQDDKFRHVFNHGFVNITKKKHFKKFVNSLYPLQFYSNS